MKKSNVGNQNRMAFVQRGVTVLELLVTTGIIGLLLMLVLPALQWSREAARRVQCQNNLRQHGLAIHHHHDVFEQFPAGWAEVAGTPAALGWIPELLPFMELAALQQRVCSAWPESLSSDAAELPGLQTQVRPAIFVCPSDIAEPVFLLFAETATDNDASMDSLSTRILTALPQANYVGVAGNTDPDKPANTEGDGSFIHGRKIAFRDLTCGLSNVAVVSERTARRLPSTWLGFHVAGEDGPGRVTGFNDFGPNNPRSDECEFDSRHLGSVNFLFADGHVRRVGDEIDREVYRRMARREL